MFDFEYTRIAFGYRGSWATVLLGFLLVVSAPVVADADENHRPTIEGEPMLVVEPGGRYFFKPYATDPDGDRLVFEVRNLPPWARFNERSGRLRGRPGPEDVGVYRDIVITASDGRRHARLEPFNITVAGFARGSAVLRWTAPTRRVDGRRLHGLSGFRVAYGLDPEDLSESIAVPSPIINSVEIESLSRGTWYFAVKALTKDGLESDYSDMVSKLIP